MATWYDSIICVSDLQAPFQHRDTLAFLEAVKKEFFVSRNKTIIVNMGDEIDAHTLGKYPANPDGMSAGLEHHKALEFMQDYYGLFPEQSFCISNHTIRPLKKAFMNGIPKAFLRDYKEFMQAPDACMWAHSFQYNGIKFEHGENVSGPMAAFLAAKANRQSTVIGHQHSHAGVIYSQTEKDLIFGLNTGCLIDTDAYAFHYGKAIREKPVLGCGVVIGDVGFFLPMKLNASKRWVGKLEYTF